MDVNIIKRIDTCDGRRFCKVIFTPNGRIKPDWVEVDERQEKHPEAMHVQWENIHFNSNVVEMRWKPQFRWMPKAYKEREVPYWNVYDTGSVCLGSMRAPDASTVASIPQWEQSFYESEFTHGNLGRLTRHAGGFEGLWKELAGNGEFPIDSLIELPETVGEFLSGKRHGHDQ
jgi:Prokaryotic E2 family D